MKMMISTVRMMINTVRMMVSTVRMMVDLRLASMIRVRM